MGNEFVGIDVSKDWLDLGVLPSEKVERVEELNARSRKYNLPKASASER